MTEMEAAELRKRMKSFQNQTADQRPKRYKTVNPECVKTDRLRGMTWNEIGEKYGYTAAGVAYMCRDMRTSKNFVAFDQKRCIFQGLRKWLNQHQVSVRCLVERMYGTSDANRQNQWYNRLSGRINLCKDDIDAILRATGMTYEQAFGEGEA